MRIILVIVTLPYFITTFSWSHGYFNVILAVLIHSCKGIIQCVWSFSLVCLIKPSSSRYSGSKIFWDISLLLMLDEHFLTMFFIIIKKRKNLRRDMKILFLSSVLITDNHLLLFSSVNNNNNKLAWLFKCKTTVMMMTMVIKVCLVEEWFLRIKNNSLRICLSGCLSFVAINDLKGDLMC